MDLYWWPRAGVLADLPELASHQWHVMEPAVENNGYCDAFCSSARIARQTLFT